MDLLTVNLAKVAVMAGEKVGTRLIQRLMTFTESKTVELKFYERFL